MRTPLRFVVTEMVQAPMRNRPARFFDLRRVNGVDGCLVFVYFLNDPDLDGPKSEREWRAATDNAFA